MTQDTPTKQTLLDTLEQQALFIGGELVLRKIGYTLRFDMIEESLGEIIKATLALKKLEGIPSNLKFLEESETQP